MNRLNAEQEAFCRQYILEKITANNNHFNAITRIMDRFQQNRLRIKQEIIQEQSVAVAVASLKLMIRDAEYRGVDISQNQQIDYYNQKIQQYVNGDDTVKRNLRERLYAVYHLQQYLRNIDARRTQTLNQNQENEYYQLMLRQYREQNVDQNINLHAQMFADFKLQGYLMNYTLTEQEKNEYFTSRQQRYLDHYEPYFQLTRDFNINISACERHFIETNNANDNRFFINIFGRVIPGLDPINVTTTWVCDSTNQVLPESLDDMYIFVIRYYRTLYANRNNTEERLNYRTFIPYFQTQIDERRVRELAYRRDQEQRGQPLPQRQDTPFGHTQPRPQPRPQPRARDPPFGRQNTQPPPRPPPQQETPRPPPRPPPQQETPRPPPRQETPRPPPRQETPRPPPQQETPRPPPQQARPPPQQETPPRPRPPPQEVTWENEVREEPCPAIRATPQPPVCWDNKTKLKYHPDKNTGCNKTATHLFTKYDALNLPKKC